MSKGTYFILLNSKLYNIFNKISIEMIMHIKELGHDIGHILMKPTMLCLQLMMKENEKIKGTDNS